MACVGLEQEALVLNTSPQHHIYDSQEEGNPLFAEDPWAFTQEGGKELLAL
jgi:hypothetical protein